LSKAHEFSQLPIKHCFSVDGNTTFLAHYDITLEESLSGIRPIQNRGVELIRDGGKFGGGIRFPGTTPNVNELKYTADCINPNEGTINLWYKQEMPTEQIINHSTSPKLFQVGSYNREGSFSIWNYHLKFSVYVRGKDSTGWTGYKTNIHSFEQNKWYMITVTWSNKDWKVYVDGELKAEFTSSQPLGAIANNVMWVGGESTFAFGSMIDEVRIDRVEKSEEEISAWYQSQAPFYPRGIHQIYG